jgi:hypothetical protein
LAYDSSGRERIEAYVRALAGCVGSDPSQLAFKWEDLEGVKHDEKVQIVRVSFMGKWTTLVFTDSEMKNLHRNPEQIFTVHKGEVLEALRRLKGLSKPVPETDCPDRWVAEGDCFPGEPA